MLCREAIIFPVVFGGTNNSNVLSRKFGLEKKEALGFTGAFFLAASFEP